MHILSMYLFFCRHIAVYTFLCVLRCIVLFVSVWREGILSLSFSPAVPSGMQLHFLLDDVDVLYTGGIYWLNIYIYMYMPRGYLLFSEK